jgi:uncharacterized protein YcbK (DUF882 family)
LVQCHGRYDDARWITPKLQHWEPNLRVKTWVICLAVVLLPATTAFFAHAAGIRFFFAGDGEINLDTDKSNHVFSGRFRHPDGRYDPAAIRAIHRVFGAPCDAGCHRISLRLLEFLDYLQDHFRPGARITIISGYRSPAYNQAIRRGGALAAKASLHQYGMAADFKLEGVDARRIWQYVKELGFGGTGYYQGDSVHMDVGPARFWDEKTSGVGSGLSDDNKLIGLVTDYDVYAPGDKLHLRFIRMTAFPIAVNGTFVLLRCMTGGAARPAESFTPEFSVPRQGSCPRFGDIDQMAAIGWTLPRKLPAGRYKLQAAFCDNPWEKMPGRVETPEFRIDVP